MSLFISNSEAGRVSRIRREKFSPDRIVTIHNGIEPPLLESGFDHETTRRAYGLAPDDGPVVAVVANLRPMKGHFDLLAVLAEWGGRHPSVRFLFAGRDDSKGRVEVAARELGVRAQVIFCGFVDDPLPLVRMADIYCMPSHWEGCPAALLEAMALEKPIVASRVGGIPELVRHEQEGLLVEPADPPSLARALDRLITDLALGRRLGAAAGVRSRTEFSMDRMVARIESVYNELIFKHVE